MFLGEDQIAEVVNSPQDAFLHFHIQKYQLLAELKFGTPDFLRLQQFRGFIFQFSGVNLENSPTMKLGTDIHRGTFC
jgi:hypothetical protein